jgi:hypothetical protein
MRLTITPCWRVANHADVGRVGKLNFFAEDRLSNTVDVASLFTTGRSATAIIRADGISTFLVATVCTCLSNATRVKIASTRRCNLSWRSFHSPNTTDNKCKRGECYNEHRQLAHGVPPCRGRPRRQFHYNLRTSRLKLIGLAPRAHPRN